jgi:tRNA threonylcarbamoyladenosine biosynthesis protein TsaB
MDAATILALDTSGATASVALYRDQVLAEASWHSGRKHSAQLLPTVDTVLDLAEVPKQTLGVIAVAVGPGSYAGLRVGVSTAMALALALDIPVIQVPTLDILAWSQATVAPATAATTPSRGRTEGEGGDTRNGRSIRAAIEVGRGHYASGRFRRVAQHLEHETRIQTVGLGELLELATVERALLVVDLDPQSRENVERHYGAQVELATPGASVRRAGYLAELAAIKIRRGEPLGGPIVEPIYLR